MLILRRFAGERIRIGNDIVIEVVDFKCARNGTPNVAIGITAPRELAVHREEVAERIKRGVPKP